MLERQKMIADVREKYGTNSKQDIFFTDLCNTFAENEWNCICICASYNILMHENIS